MSKVLIFGDVHCYPHKRSSERLQHCIDALDWVFSTAIERQIENVIFLGDLFHDRQKIDLLTYQKTYEVFEKYLINMARETIDGGGHSRRTPPFKIYLLLGNHDLWHYTKWDVSSVTPLRAINGVNIVDKPSTWPIYFSDTMPTEEALVSFLVGVR